jgi:hypothetical protein
VHRAINEGVTSNVIAFVALIVSLVSAGWQAVETRRVRQIERDRRQEQRSPQFRRQVESMNDGRWHRLWVVLSSPEALDSLSVKILDTQLLWFPAGQTGVQPGPDSKHASWGHVEPGVRDVALRQ